MKASASYRPTIGLEIHAELSTKTKMFCDSRNDPEETRANVNVCPVCLAHPGTLPTVNKEAVRHVLRVGSALGSTLADYSEFDRKSYFYPDIPKGFQISQYEHPLVAGGSLNGVAITRVHLEEDTARSSHAGGASLVDFNRAGVPLMELVTEPVIHDAKTAGDFARELQLLLRTLGASEANLEKGEMRIEANVSVSKDDSFGTKVEVKNLNSFRSVERAIAYEIERQTALIESGGKVDQETRGWDEGKQETFHQRFKEGSADYRYFPEPDIPKLVLSEVVEFSEEAIRASLPELPWETRNRLKKEGVREDAVDVLMSNPVVSIKEFYETLSKLNKTEYVGPFANFIVQDVMGSTRVHGTVSPNFKASSVAGVTNMFVENKISSRGAKDIITILVKEGGDPEIIASERGLLQVSDERTLKEAVRAVIAEHAGVAKEYQGGKDAALQFLVGQAMKATKGAGNPAALAELIREALPR